VVRVRARVTSTAPVAEVRVGTGAATLSGPQEYSAEVPLSLGDNSITVYARDTDGLSASATVQVRYRSAASEPLTVTGVDPLPGTADVETDSLISVAFNKPVLYESLAERFTVSADGVPLAGGYSLAPGGQTATFVAREPLPEGKRLTVRVSGVQPAQVPGMGGDFTSDFSVRHPLTRVRGLVMEAPAPEWGGGEHRGPGPHGEHGAGRQLGALPAEGRRVHRAVRGRCALDGGAAAHGAAPALRGRGRADDGRAAGAHAD
jgi:hypothetical protein